MMMSIPMNSYGVLRRNQVESCHQEAAEQVRDLGFAVLDAGFTNAELERISAAFEHARRKYIDVHGEAELRAADEFHTMRAMLVHGGPEFVALAVNPHLMSVMELLISGKFILNQQNGIINPPHEHYNQGAWHRDLPYQHFVSSQPLAINALFCVDEFTEQNGATFVLPASHKSERFPSEKYIRQNARQITARAGSFILLDCMLFHTGGFNQSNAERRAVNHVYNIPFFKQQIALTRCMFDENLTDKYAEVFGFDYTEPPSIDAFLARRSRKA